MSKKSNRFLLGQKIALGAVIVIAIAVLGGLYMMVLTETPLGEFVEGEHYTLIENPRRIRGDKIEVMEFFSYGCIHCFNFDDRLSAWVEEHEAHVNFVRTPAIGSNYWRILGRAYYTMEELGVRDENHSMFFREIHQQGNGMDSLNDQVTWMEGHGVTPAAYRSMFGSSVVDRKIELADQMARRLLISTVPTIIVNGKYMVRSTGEVGPSRMLDVMDYLLAKEITDKDLEAAGAATTPAL